MYTYPVAQPDIGELEKKYVNEALNQNEISSQGDFIKRFEKLFSEKHKAKFGVACNSGTNAIFLALRALGIGEGDEVIVPDFTMIATAWAVSYTGANPIFVDCDERFCIDVNKIEEKITPKTKAIIPVHIYGRVCDMDRILKIARDYNLKVVEDSCEAISTPVRGDIACFSLYANKVITSGEGGICITNDENLAWQMKHLRSMAFSEGHTFYHPKMGYNFRMTNLQGAVALAQIERLEELLEKRKQIESWYEIYLPKFVGLKRNVLWMYDILVEDREKFVDYLKQNGIETRLFFKPMTMQPMYRQEVGENAFKYSKLGLYLPTHTQLTEKDVKWICDMVNRF